MIKSISCILPSFGWGTHSFPFYRLGGFFINLLSEKLAHGVKLKNLIPLLLLTAAGFLFLSPHLIYQKDLSQGDHGRDLYSFQAVLQGEIPYRDFWWVYGPLMPYYYAIFYKTIGASVASVLLGQTLLTLCSGVLVYLSLVLFIPPLFAFIGALWFWTYFPDFYFTYNHTGGITLLLAITYTLLLYVKKQRTQYLFWGLAGIFLLSFVKINFGFSALISYLLSVRWIDKTNHLPATIEKKRFYTVGLKILPLSILGIYVLLVWGMPLYEIRQCFPYWPSDHPYHTPFEKWLKEWPKTVLANTRAEWPHQFFGILVISSIVSLFYLLKKNKILPLERSHFFLAGKILVLFYFFQLHEYMNGATTDYRLYWAKPFSLLLSFLLVGTVMQYYWPVVRWLTLGMLLYATLTNFHGQIGKLTPSSFYNNFWTHPRGQIFIPGNGGDWIKTADQTSSYLKAHLKNNETFFALPYEPLYYYLLEKKSPTQMLIFFDHIKIPPKQEENIIADLEKHRINYIVLSNRMKSIKEDGCGILGETYCPLLGNYIEDHFETVATYGDWGKEPLWAWNHATKILRKKEKR